VPSFEDYARRFTDLPLLVTLRQRDGAYVSDRLLRTSDLERPDGRPPEPSAAVIRLAGPSEPGEAERPEIPRPGGLGAWPTSCTPRCRGSSSRSGRSTASCTPGAIPSSTSDGPTSSTASATAPRAAGLPSVPEPGAPAPALARAADAARELGAAGDR
jgi:hypothetical protein